MSQDTSTWRDRHEFLARIEGDLIYAGLLLSCALIALILRKCTGLVRHSLDGLIGLLLTLVMTRWMVFYSLIKVVLHLILYKYVRSPRYNRTKDKSYANFQSPRECFVFWDFYLSCHIEGNTFCWTATPSIYSQCYTVDYDTASKTYSSDL